MRRDGAVDQPAGPLTLAIAGGGRAAWAFGSEWRRIGWPVDGVWLRDSSASRLPELLGVARKPLAGLRADVLLIAVSDRALREVHAAVGQTEAVVFHASGFTPAFEGGFSLHPLKALPPVGEPSSLEDVLLVFQGDRPDLARRIAAATGSRFAEISAEAKPLYHAAAVFGSNYVAAVLEIAARLIGIPEARHDLARLASSAIANWESHEDRRRFTGPAVRGDREVMERHLEALRDHPQVKEAYKLLAAEIERAILAPPK